MFATKHLSLVIPLKVFGNRGVVGNVNETLRLESVIAPMVEVWYFRSLLYTSCFAFIETSGQ